MRINIRRTGPRRTIGKYELADWAFCFYTITICVTLISTGINAVLQNIAYLSFIGLVLYRRRMTVAVKTFIIQYGIFVLYAALSLLWSINQNNSITLLRICIKTFFFMLFADAYYDTSERLDKAMMLLYIGLILSFVYVMLNSSLSEWIHESVGKNVGIDTVRMAVRMSLCAFLAFYFWHKTHRSRHLILMVVLLILSLLTGKRTSIVFILSALFVYNLSSRKNTLKKLKVILLTACGIVLIWIAILKIPALSETIGARISNFISTFFYGVATDASTVERTYILKYSISLWKKSPFFGNGLNSTRSYLNSIGFSHATYAHNNYLEIASGLGLLGVFIYYAIYMLPLGWALKTLARKKDRPMAFLLSILVAMLVCDLLQVSYDSYYELLLLCLISTGIERRRKEMLSQCGGELSAAANNTWRR